MKNKVYVFKELDCCVCGAKVILEESKLNYRLKKDLGYLPTCSDRCRAIRAIEVINNMKMGEYQPSPHHKGYHSRKEWNRRSNLVRSGRASWWQPRRSIDQALKVAGLA